MKTSTPPSSFSVRCRTIFWLAASLIAGCLDASAAEGVAGALQKSRRSDELIQARATNVWQQAFLLKPLETVDAGLEYRLAPLLMFVGGTNVPPATLTNPAIGTVAWDGSKAQVDASSVAVYWAFDAKTLEEGESGRMTYLWFRECGLGRTNEVVEAQGIRIRLDTNGQPFLWEVLTDSSGARVYYVSKNYEAKKNDLHLSVLADRPTNGDAPEVIKARVLDDAPVPMGPIVCIEPATGDVLSVICRCMTAQAEALAGSASYELHPADVLPPGLASAFRKGD